MVVQLLIYGNKRVNVIRLTFSYFMVWITVERQWHNVSMLCQSHAGQTWHSVLLLLGMIVFILEFVAEAWLK